MQDWLAETAALQEGTYGYDFAGMPLEEKTQYIKDMILAAEDELHEALGEVGWKPWASERFINREAFIGELVDAGHFLANLLVAVGCTDDEWDEAYHSKRKRNIERKQVVYYLRPRAVRARRKVRR